MEDTIIKEFENYLFDSNYKSTTIKNYISVVREYFRYTNNYLINKNSLYDYLTFIRENNKSKTENFKRTALKSYDSFLTKHNYPSYNIAHIQGSKINLNCNCFDYYQYRDFINYICSSDLLSDTEKFLLYLLANYGFKTSEIFNLKWRDYKNKCEIEINSHSRTYCFYTDNYLNYLLNILYQKTFYSEEGYIITNKNLRQYNSNNLHQLFRRINRRLNLNINSYFLRRSYIFLQIQKGIAPIYIARHLGLKNTFHINSYYKLSPAMTNFRFRKVFNKWERSRVKSRGNMDEYSRVFRVNVPDATTP